VQVNAPLPGTVEGAELLGDLQVDAVGFSRKVQLALLGAL